MLRTTRISIPVFSILVLILTPIGHAQAQPAPTEPAAIGHDELRDATDLAGKYLMQQVRDDGSFVYRINIDPDVKVKPRYNWLRHAGTLYALSDYYHLSENPELVPLIEKSVNHMRTKALAPVTDWPGAMAIWTDGRITGAKGPLTAKLGGAGLGLVAMTALNRIIPDTVPIDDMRALGRFILAMQKPNGEFYSKFTPSKGGPQDDWVSLFYPGEAALGLTELYALDNDPRWLSGAIKTIQYLAAKRQGKATVPSDHWVLIATGRVWPHLADSDRVVFKRHARQVVDTILADQIWEQKDPGYGGFSADGRTTPTATRLEGLLAAEFLFRDDPAYHRKLEVAISWGVRFMLKAQLKSERYKGAFTRAIGRVSSSHPKARSFNRRATEVRIDYVQHALSAFIQYRAFQKELL